MIYMNIKKRAKKQGLSLPELEKRAGLGNGTISRWKKSKPRVDNLKSVADVLNVSVTTLMKDD